jgi:hypothetical protein
MAQTVPIAAAEVARASFHFLEDAAITMASLSN